MLPRLKAGRLNRELLVRAARIKGAQVGEGPLRAVDATAGLGEDALLLAAAGFEVMLSSVTRSLPRSWPIACAARGSIRSSSMPRHDYISRAPTASKPCRRFDPAPDVVYLDPMFPERRKSAAVKKKFQLIHYLDKHPCDDQEALMRAALAANPPRWSSSVRSRGRISPDFKPSYSLAGKSVRYDCIVPVR